MAKSKLFDDLKEGLDEALAYHQKKIDLKTTTVVLPDEPPKLTARQVKEIREKKLHLSQPVFAICLGVTPAAVKAWEQGTKSPSGTARRLMQLYRDRPELIGMISSTKRRAKA